MLLSENRRKSRIPRQNESLYPAAFVFTRVISVTRIVDIVGASPGGVPLGSNFVPPLTSLTLERPPPLFSPASSPSLASSIRCNR
ncbi:PREDICTED: uncharacterized protein LOC108749777 isoform X3 [Trachymyrmex septentrionalis]|uniref:uncharacterized protein LOC108749777 isoform X3 n=1 Tax=Trachymyrmex septentrionalis TaxID=34720 RepID=UPI00084EFA0A|nr:PREDICTED: uncharacterized protein LOC108749777 isoform X3 [Trachymyrmex septentrionalis]